MPEIRTVHLFPEDPNQIAKRLQMQAQQDARTNKLVPLYVTWTRDVPQIEAQAALQGVFDVVAASGQRREVLAFGPQQFGQGEYSNSDWYVEEAYNRQHLRRDLGYGPQVVPSNIISLFHQEPWQREPHWEVFILNRDLTSGEPDNNFVFGETNISFPASVQSIRRLIVEVSDPVLRASMVRRLLRHEVGHMFGLTNRNFHVEEKLGKHCTNICTMRQGMSVPEWAQQAVQEERLGIHFCGDCQTELSTSRFLRM